MLIQKCNTSDNTAVGIDAEWQPEDLSVTSKRKKLTNSASLLQIAFSDVVFLIDLLNLHETTLAQISKLFTKQSITKIGFGLAEDVQRLQFGCSISPVVDIQSVALRICTSLQSGCNPSLGHVAKLFLGGIDAEAKNFTSF